MEGPARRLVLTSAVLVVSLTLLPAAPGARATVPVLIRQGLVLPMGPAGSIDSLQAFFPSVIIDGGDYRMWYSACDPSYYCQIAYATSPDGRTWSKHGAVLSPTGSNESLVAYASVVKTAAAYWMFYGGSTGGGSPTYQIFVATSPDGIGWNRQGLAVGLGSFGSSDAYGALYPSALFVNGTFMLFYTGLASLSPPGNAAILLAVSTDGLHWTKEGVVLAAGAAGSLDAYDAGVASVVRVGPTYEMLYVGTRDATNQAILSAESSDSIHWEKLGVALAPSPSHEKGVGQPDIVVNPGGDWNVYYVVRNGASDLQIYLATSAPSVSVPPISPPSAVTWLEALGITGMGGGVGALCAWGVGVRRRGPS